MLLPRVFLIIAHENGFEISRVNEKVMKKPLEFN